MICKICGCEMINNGSWLACPTCGAVEFGVTEETSAENTVSETSADRTVSAKNTSNAESTADRIESLDKSFEEFLASFSPLSKVEEEKTEPKTDPAPVIEEKPKTPESDTISAFEKEIEEPITPKAPIPDEKAEAPATPKAPVSPKKAETPKEEPVAVPEVVKEASNSDITSIFDEKDESEEESEVFFTKDFDSTSVKLYSFTDDFVPETAESEAFSNDSDGFDEGFLLPDDEEPVMKANKKKGKDKKKSPLKDIIDFLIPIVAAVVIAFFLKTFIIANAVVPTGSMMETINIKDRIIASRLAYKTESPSRYDIILFYYPENEKEIFVKRVLGLPGETLTVIDGVVYVTTKDGKTIQTEQSFVNPTEAPKGNYGPYYIPEKGEKITVENGYCYAENGMALGTTEFLDKYCVRDSRGNYVIEHELYFMIGDNRNNSHDSRMWTFPYVSDDKIIGKVIFKYYPNFEKLG